MRLRHLPALLIAVVLCGVLMWMQGRYDDALVKWNAHVEAAQSMARRNAHRADSLTWEAYRNGRAADSLQAVADALRARRTAIRVRVDTVEVPEAARPYTAPRDTLIAVLTEENDTLRSVAERLRYSNADLLAANSLLTESVDSLNAVLDRRPKPRSRLLPSLGVGVMAGVCSDLRPCTGVGITLSWKVSL